MENEAYRGESSQLLGGRRFPLGGGKKQKEELDWFRTHDAFVNMPNLTMLRRDFTNLTQRGGWVVVLIHINDFTRLNSIFGLDIGGRTLQRVCPVLSDFAGRAGGQAYRISVARLVVLAPVSDREGFLAGLEETLLQMQAVQVEDEYTVYAYHYTFSYSAYMLSDLDQDYQDLESLLAFSDIAARTGHRQIYDLGTRPNWAKGEASLPDVRQAWQSGEFEPAYQPVYDLKSGKPVGAELLIRWRHPKLGQISPAEFFPLMEAEGLMMDMDLYMLEAACKKIKGWMDAELVTIPLSVNICRQNIHRADFLPRLIEIVTSYEVPPVLLELELSESALIFENNKHFLYMMDQLHRVGFTLTMDDCASSEFSSISLLRDLPIDKMKISPRFIQGVEESNRDRIFVSGILRMAQELGIQTIATGIETQEQVGTWMQMGCCTGQGFHLSRPLFHDAFEKLIF